MVLLIVAVGLQWLAPTQLVAVERLTYFVLFPAPLVNRVTPRFDGAW